MGLVVSSDLLRIAVLAAAVRCRIWSRRRRRCSGGLPVAAWVRIGADPSAGEYQVYDLPSGTLRHRIPARASAEKAFSPDGHYLAVVGPAGGVRVYDLESGGEVFRWHQPDAGQVEQVRFTPSGGLAVLPRGGGQVRVLHMEAVRRQLVPRGLGW